MVKTYVNGFRIHALLLGICIAAPVAATDAKAGLSVGAYVHRCHERGECNGTYLVARGGRIIFRGAVGTASADGQTRLDPGFAFDIGSIAKQFTAAAVVRLAERGRLRLDDPVATHLAGFPWPGITIRQLLNQTSGVPDVMPHYTKRILDGATQGPVDLSDIVQVLKDAKLPPAAAPGTVFAYSNTGYALLGRIVEVASGKSYATFLQDEFFVPLGMRHTWVRTPAVDTPPGVDRAYGMRHGGAKPFDQVPHLYLYGPGGIYATADDLLIWADALSRGKVMSAPYWTMATTPVTLPDGSISAYGFGFDLARSAAGARRISHGGHWRGFKADLSIYPENDVVVVILTNDGEDDEVEHARDDIERRMRAAYR